jgi:hypothetical protein
MAIHFHTRLEAYLFFDRALLRLIEQHGEGDYLNPLYELTEGIWFTLDAREQAIAQIPLIKQDVDRVADLHSHLNGPEIPGE